MKKRGMQQKERNFDGYKSKETPLILRVVDCIKRLLLLPSYACPGQNVFEKKIVKNLYLNILLVKII